MSSITRRQDHSRFIAHKGPRYSFVYRGVLVSVREGYAHPRIKSQQVVIHFPDIEAWSSNTSGVRRAIDRFLAKYQPIDNGIPF